MLLDDFVGKTINDYTVLERIAEGGMAVVYRAHQATIDRDVALKVVRLDAESAQTAEFQYRFAQEAHVVAALEHIHILPIYDYGVVGNMAYIAMRWLRGGSVSTLLRQGPLTPDRAARLLEQVALGLGYAHDKGIIHRDIKPSNILLDDVGNAYLSDFGLAKLLGQISQHTQSGSIVGTPLYMAPEQVRGQPASYTSDIYSLGMVLYHMVTGRAAFQQSEVNIPALIYNIIERNPLPPDKVNPSLTPDISKVVMRALHKDPVKRYQRPESLADNFNIAIGRLSPEDMPTRAISSSRTPAAPLHRPALSTSSYDLNPPTITQHQLKQRRRQLLLVGGLLLFGLVTAVILWALLLGGEQSASNADETEASFTQVATVLAGEIGDANEAVPSPAEIEQARAALGEDGFVAYIACTQETDYHAKQAREMRDFFSEYGMDFQVYDPNTQPYRQLTLVERARAEGARGLIICPLDPSLLQEALIAVDRAQMPLVLLSNMETYGGVRLVGDEYEMGLRAGRTAGQLIKEEMGGQARVLILDFPDMPSLVTRANGLEDGVLQVAHEAEIVGRQRGGTPDLGYTSVRALLQDGVAFDVIVSINDAGAIGAVRALEEAGVPPDEVAIVSIDAETQALNYIREGNYFRATESVGREAFSRAAVDAMTRLLGGGTLPETILVPPGEMITRDDLLNDEDDTAS